LDEPIDQVWYAPMTLTAILFSDGFTPGWAGLISSIKQLLFDHRPV